MDHLLEANVTQLPFIFIKNVCIKYSDGIATEFSQASYTVKNVGILRSIELNTETGKVRYSTWNVISDQQKKKHNLGYYTLKKCTR